MFAQHQMELFAQQHYCSNSVPVLSAHIHYYILYHSCIKNTVPIEDTIQYNTSEHECVQKTGKQAEHIYLHILHYLYIEST